MRAVVTIEGLTELRGTWKRAIAELEANVREAALDAAAAGILAAQTEHPYQDHRDPKKSYRWKGALGLTDTSHAEQNRKGSQGEGFEAEMVWPADYAYFVDRGTSRYEAYPFTPIATTTADLVLNNQVERALALFERAVG